MLILLCQFIRQMTKFEWDNLAKGLKVFKFTSISRRTLNEEEVQRGATRVRRLGLIIN